MLSDPFFEASPSTEMDSHSSPVASGSPKLLELSLLCVLLVVGVSEIILAVGTSTSGWAIGYLISVFVGVPTLGFHTQSVLRRFETIGSALTNTAKILRFFLACLLVLPALVNAVHLAVKWSS
jgi:hypothetical protein